MTVRIIILACLIVTSPVLNKAQQAQKQPEKQNESKSPKSGTESIPNPAVPPSATSTTTPNKSAADTKTPGSYGTSTVLQDIKDVVNILAELALVGIGFYGVKTALRTLRSIKKQVTANETAARASLLQAEAASTQVNLMERQTAVMETSVEAAMKSADAAKLSAGALINSERAWLILEGLNGSIMHINFMIKNWGRTPAWMTEIGFWYVKSTEDISATIDYSEHPVNQLSHRPTIAPGERTPHYNAKLDGTGLITEQEETAVRNGLLFLHFFGICKYIDIFGESRITRFCLTWQPHPDESFLRYAGPPENNHHT